MEVGRERRGEGGKGGGGGVSVLYNTTNIIFPFSMCSYTTYPYTNVVATALP